MMNESRNPSGLNRMVRKTGSPFYVPSPSPWPFWFAFALQACLLSMAKYMHSMNSVVLWGSILLSLIVVYMWFKDVIVESLFQGLHTWAVQRGFRHAFALFLVSEAFFFLSFFWGFFHSSLAPSEAGGKRWPPIGIHTMNCLGIPLMNTVILVSSAMCVTWAHKALRRGVYQEAFVGMLCTIIHGAVFLFFQYEEFATSSFSIADGIYGSAFFCLVGLHGLHVLAGMCALILMTGRLVKFHFSTERHAGLRFAIWYWHYVDVIWVILYLSIYVWKS